MPISEYFRFDRWRESFLECGLDPGFYVNRKREYGETSGYNPHPRIVFGLPLSVGVTSEAEYADFELNESVTPGEFTG